MAGAEIAYVATAGASGLALAVSVWAWRAHRQAAAVVQQADARRREAERTAGAAAGAHAAFDDVRIVLDPESSKAVVVGDPSAVSGMKKRLLGDVADSDFLNALRAAPETTERLKDLTDNGTSFDVTVPGPGGAMRVEGRARAGTAWLRLTPLDAPAQALGVLDGVAERAPAPIWVLDAGGRLAWANAAFLEEVRALSLDDARERNLSFERGADQLGMEAGRLASRQEGFRWTTSGGKRKAWKISAEPAPAGASILFAVDMTEAEETRDTLRRHVEGHDETLNHLADAVAIFSSAKRLAFHNTAFQQLFGLEAAWLDERPSHAELLDRLRQRRLLPETVDYAGWKARELEFYGASQAAPDDSWSLPDGRTLRVVRQPHPLGGVLLIFSDITDDLRLRSRYNAQLQVQTATLDKLNDAVAVFGSDGRIRLHNDAFEDFWGLGAEQIAAVGDLRTLSELCKTVIPDAGLWQELTSRVADPDPESRIPVSGEARANDGRWAAWQTRPLPDGATLVAFSDVTARRELEQALRAKEAALEESQALKREFVGSVSYELRTPLTTIVGYAELLETLGQLDDRSRQHAGAIRVAAGHLARSIDDVLDMAQIDAGEMELSLGDARLADVLEGCADRARPRVEGRKADLALELQPGLGTIRADARRIEQMVDHLLDNAARAVMEGGRVTLKAERTSSEVRVSVSDTGRGIPYHQQAHVFDRFIQRERGGPGLGLALVKALTELHGGWAEVESEPGKGATFTLHLPLTAFSSAAAPELDLGDDRAAS